MEPAIPETLQTVVTVRDLAATPVLLIQSVTLAPVLMASVLRFQAVHSVYGKLQDNPYAMQQEVNVKIPTFKRLETVKILLERHAYLNLWSQTLIKTLQVV